MHRVALRPLSVGEILDVAIKITWRNARTLIPLVAIVIAPAEILTVLILSSSSPTPTLTPQLGNPTLQPTPRPVRLPPHELWTAFAGFGVVTVLFLIASVLATAACYKAVTDAYLGELPDRGRSLTFALHRLGSVLWVTALGTLATALGFVACLIPGIWLYVSFAVAVPVVLTEGTRGRRALGRSFRLVKGRWWPTAGLIFLGFLLVSIVSGAIGVLLTGLLLTGAGGNAAATLTINAVGRTVGAIVTTPFTAAFVTVLYFDLRVRKEGFDLQLMAEAVGVAPPEGGFGPPPSLTPPPVTSSAEPPFWPPPPGWRPPDQSGGM